jgi:hypothetical protein
VIGSCLARGLTVKTPTETDMAQPYIPNKDADYDNWLANFSTLISADPTDYGLVAGDATAIAAVNTSWHAAYLAATNPSTRTSATIATKDGERATSEATVRPYAIRIRDNDSVSEALKVGLGLTIPKFPPTPIPAPVKAPVLSIVAAIPFEQTLGYKTVGEVGKSKPFGATGMELWRSVGTVAAVDPEQCRYYGTFGKSPLKSSFDAADVGKIVTYFGRFVTRSGPAGKAQAGPWSAALSLTIM